MTARRRVRVAIFGDLLYDCFVWAERLPRIGETVTGFRNGFFAGGKGGNQAVAAARLGAEAFMLGKVGNDSHGDFLRNSLKQNQVVDAGVITDSTMATGTCCVHIDRKGNNAIIVVPLANEAINMADTTTMEKYIQQSDVFLCQLQTNLDAVERCLYFAKLAGKLTILNPAPAKREAARLFPLADYLTPNETEAEDFTQVMRSGMSMLDWCQSAVVRMHNAGAKRVVITLGEKGAFYSDGSKCFNCPPVKVEAVDSTAAGDAFNAALAIEIAKGRTIEDALRFANGAGAVAASLHGSQPSLPSRSQVESLLAGGSER